MIVQLWLFLESILMNSINLYSYKLGNEYDSKRKNKVPLNTPIFVIGVRNSDNCDLDTFLKIFSEFKLEQRLPEVVNLNYLEEAEEHTLQPAVLIKVK